MPLHVIYHSNCPDGAMAATILADAYPNAELHPASHGQEPPVTTGDIIMVDFSFKRPVFESLLETADSVRLLDHHVGAAEELEGLVVETYDPDEMLVVDQSASGALLAWYHVVDHFPEQDWSKWSLPAALVDDVDRWQHKLPDSDPFVTAVGVTPFEKLGALCSNMEEALSFGRGAVALRDAEVRSAVATSWEVEFEGARGRAAFGSFRLSSHLGHALASEGYDFGLVLYRRQEGAWKGSIRSTDAPCRWIAQRHGGDGHDKAAGFTLEELGPFAPTGL